MRCCNCKIIIETSKDINYECCYCHTYYYYCDKCLENTISICPSCEFYRCAHCYGRTAQNITKCTCGIARCEITTGGNYCHYCKNVKLHIISKSTERNHVCCHCIIKIKYDTDETKKLLNNILCDPSRIVDEYLDDEIYNGDVLKRNSSKRFLKLVNI
jgi:hypothetical protein